jgi:hypothetical protein
MGLALASFSLLLAVGLTLWLPDAGMSHGTADSELGAALLGGAVVALVVFFTGQQSQREEAQRALARSLVDQFMSPAAMESLTATTAFLRIDEHDSQESRWTAWEELPDLDKAKIVGPLNTLESIGGAYLAREASRPILYGHLDVVAPALWDQAKWFVSRLRDALNDPHLLEMWEGMVADFRSGSGAARPKTYEPSTAAPDAD